MHFFVKHNIISGNYLRLEFEVTLSSLGAMNPVISSEYEKNQNVLQNIISIKKYEVLNIINQKLGDFKWRKKNRKRAD